MVGAIKGNLDALDERANAADKLITSLNGILTFPLHFI